jgi:hypothetical protein
MVATTQTTIVPNRAALRIMERFAEYNKSGESKSDTPLELNLSDIPMDEIQLRLMAPSLSQARVVGLSLVINPDTKVLDFHHSLFRHLTSLTLTPFSPVKQNLTNISIIGKCANLTELTVNHFHTVIDFDFLSNLTKLRKLNLSGCSAITQFSLSQPIVSLSSELRELKLVGCSSLNSLPLSNYSSVRVLNVSDCPSLGFLNTSKGSGFSGLFALTCENSPQLVSYVKELSISNNLKHFTTQESGKNIVLMNKLDNVGDGYVDMKAEEKTNNQNMLKFWTFGNLGPVKSSAIPPVSPRSAVPPVVIPPASPRTVATPASPRTVATPASPRTVATPASPRTVATPASPRTVATSPRTVATSPRTVATSPRTVATPKSSAKPTKEESSSEEEEVKPTAKSPKSSASSKPSAKPAKEESSSEEEPKPTTKKSTSSAKPAKESTSSAKPAKESTSSAKPAKEESSSEEEPPVTFRTVPKSTEQEKPASSPRSKPPSSIEKDIVMEQD